MTQPADHAPPHLLAFIAQHDIRVELIAPGAPMPTVASAAAALRVAEELILKTLLFASNGEFVIAIANGTKRVSAKLLAQASGLSAPRPAKPEIVQTVTGYPAGGVAPIALPAGLPVIVDAAAAALPWAFGGAGREELMLGIAPADVVRLNHATVARIVET